MNTKTSASHKATPKVSAKTRSPLLGLRASKEDIETLDEAAKASRMTRTSFVLHHSLKAADLVLKTT